MAMRMLLCHLKEQKEVAPKDCVEKITDELVINCLQSLNATYMDDYMLFFGQIDEICVFLNHSSPMITTETIKDVCFRLGMLGVTGAKFISEFKRNIGGNCSNDRTVAFIVWHIIKFHTYTQVIETFINNYWSLFNNLYFEIADVGQHFPNGMVQDFVLGWLVLFFTVLHGITTWN